MPKIIGQAEQQAAMKEIKSALKEMRDTNLFLETLNNSKKYTISFVSEDGTKHHAVAYTEKKEDLDRFVLHYKHLMANRVVKLASENRISLDLDEKLAFSLDLTPEEEEELTRRELAELEDVEASFHGTDIAN